MEHNLFGYIGATGPIILNILTILLLFNKKMLLYVYIAGTIVNTILNFLLKILIKQPRPKEDKVFFELAKTNGKRMSADRFGMPSGHAQSVGFSCMFMYFVCNDMYTYMVYLIIGLITLMQRFYYNAHTILQIITGLFIGILMGYVSFCFAKYLLKGKISSKKDDNCFL